jgi:DNA-binding NarL/FixJ family response regulator
MAARIIIFEDNHKLRESLALLLNNHDGYEVVGHYPDCVDATEIVRVDNPDVVLMDIDMPGKSGIEGVSMVKEAKPNAAVIIYTVFEDDEKLFKCLANGYLLKKTPPQKLFDAIHEVLEGGAPLSPQIAKKVLNTFYVNTTKFKYALTPREMEVLQYLTKGYGSKQIAAEMFLSYETVRSHLKNIYQKLHVNCGKEAIVKALQEQIV